MDPRIVVLDGYIQQMESRHRLGENFTKEREVILMLAKSLKRELEKKSQIVPSEEKLPELTF